MLRTGKKYYFSFQAVFLKNHVVYCMCGLIRNNRIRRDYFFKTHENAGFNHLEPEFYIQILAHSVRKMCIIQEPKKVAL